VVLEPADASAYGQSLARPFRWVGRTRRTKAEREAAKNAPDPEPIWQSRFDEDGEETQRSFVARLQRRFWPHLKPREVLALRPSDIAAIAGLDETDDVLAGDTAGAVRELTEEERERIYSKRGTGGKPKLRAVKGGRG
jgi:hypothetical protein